MRGKESYGANGIEEVNKDEMGKLVLIYLTERILENK